MGQAVGIASSLEELSRRLGGKIVGATPACRQARLVVARSGISIDSRTLQPGNVFIAIRGKRLDGHQFLAQARERGACAFVVDQDFYRSLRDDAYSNLVTVQVGCHSRESGNPVSFPPKADPPSAEKIGKERHWIPAHARSAKKPAERVLAGMTNPRGERLPNLIVVPDTTQALQKLASSVRDDFKGPCVGITGSSGKTTTKEIVKAFMESKWNVLASEGNQNNYIGLPLGLLKLDSSHEAVLAELGASWPGEIGELCEVLKPDWGIITNVYPCHLEGFGTLENIYQTKLDLAKKILARGGKVVVNGDDNHLLSLLNGTQKGRVTFGTQSGCDFVLTSMAPSGSGIEFTVNHKYPFRLETQGKFNVLNALGAIALAMTLGIDPAKLREILAHLKLPKSRFQLFTSPQGIRIIDDAYNSNPTSLRLAIESFEEMKTDGRKILVAADMLELGEREKEFHESLGRSVAHKAIDAVVTVGPLMKEFLEGLHRFPDRRPVTYGFATNQEAREFLKEFLKSGDLVLFKGSRSMKLEEIIECFMPSYTR